MRRRYVGFAVWLALSVLLYFFENNTGSRIVLSCTLLLPLVPFIRHGLWGRDESQAPQPRLHPQTVQTFVNREAEAAGDVRAYLPGDPVNRIHWKLSAKRNELLVREEGRDRTAEEDETKAVPDEEGIPQRRTGKRVFRTGLGILLPALISLILIPSANQGVKALMNRVFEASEAVNAYAYDRLDVPTGQPVALAAILLAIVALSLLGMTLASGSRLLALGLMAGGVLFQVYFGLAFPAWVQVTLFTLFALWMTRCLRNRQTSLCAVALIAIVSIAVSLLIPGVDPTMEAASEAVRDRLSEIAQSITGAAREEDTGENETRHTHTQSLTAGEEEARTNREYRLKTVEEEQISRPHWVNYLRIILLLLLTVALVIVPFLPFMVLNQRRKKALEARKAFQSENVSEAVTAIFQQVTAWLEATGNGGDNALYAAWQAELSPDYARRFVLCEKLFEEAAYSTHEMNEEHRQQALELLRETEEILWRKCDWRQRLRLRFRECLWV